MNLKYKRTLLYYDGPVLFDAVDASGKSYLGMVVEAKDEWSYVLIEMPEERLEEFAVGKSDLLSVMQKYGRDHWYQAAMRSDGLVANRRDGPVPTEFMPEPGFLLHPGD